MKSKYITPEITVVEFKVEAGFAESAAQAGQLSLSGGNFVGSGNGGSGSNDWKATGMESDNNYQDIFSR